MDEFTLIQRFFASGGVTRDDVVLGVGDDGAVLRCPPHQELVMTSDILLAGHHFPEATPACDIGYKSLAANLSDLAAMGAEPAWASLQLVLPEADETWLSDFIRGFYELAKVYNLQLVGGDTVRGPLTVGVQLCGWVPTGKALTRGGAKPGDSIYVTGSVGDAALGLGVLQGAIALAQDRHPQLIHRLNRPDPRVQEGMVLRDRASAAIDLSDGLIADLGHILSSSHVGASIELDRIPVSDIYRAYLQGGGDWAFALSHGDDYELCFTLPPEYANTVQEEFARLSCPLHQIGAIESEAGLRVYQTNGSLFETGRRGFNHFS
ncbi:MAG TPA: thiamine-phosphate kinase [Acidiferrobacteraceae bacterium]|nr:thiamine-phosphate kinase [Acidiferrobacteraceae bacterium]